MEQNTKDVCIDKSIVDEREKIKKKTEIFANNFLFPIKVLTF